MDTLIAYFDDAEHACHQLLPLLSSGTATAQQSSTHWILVACPPRMTRRVSKWVSYANRENWRARWADKVTEPVVQAVVAPGDQLTRLVAHGSLADLSDSLRQQFPGARVLDARRPKLGQDLPAVTHNQPEPHGARWAVPGAVAGLGAALVLATE